MKQKNEFFRTTWPLWIRYLTPVQTIKPLSVRVRKPHTLRWSEAVPKQITLVLRWKLKI